ncbi:MAG TPA: hypothetical protein VGI99_07820 [Gemmataceae bacterium]|jgi:hypothetical protein
MMLSCPYCNHAFAASSASRVVCPRCGETVPGRSAEAAPAPFDPFSTDISAVVKSRLKFAAVAIAVIFVVIAGTVAKYILDERRKQKQLPPQPVVASLPHAPLQLPALNHLPPGTNLVIAIQPGPIVAVAERTNQDPVAILMQAGIPESVLGALVKAGITLQQIDHAAIGIDVPSKDQELRLCIALSFRQPLPDEAAILRQLQAKPSGSPGRFEVQVDKFPLQMARVSKTLWLFGLGEKDLAGASGSPLPADFQEVIGQHIPSDAAIWAAAAPANWNDKPILKLLKKDWLALVGSRRAAALAFAEAGRLSLALQSETPQDADKLRNYFKSRATGEHSTANGTGNWATLSIPIEPKAASSALADLVNGLPR